MFFSLKFSPAVKPIQRCSMEVAPCVIDLNETHTRTQVAFKLIYDYQGNTSRFIHMNGLVLFN